MSYFIDVMELILDCLGCNPNLHGVLMVVLFLVIMHPYQKLLIVIDDYGVVF